MKSRTSFFNGNVLKKDVTRFSPVWSLYAIGLALTIFSLYTSSVRQSDDLAENLSYMLKAFSVVNLIYGIVNAMLLFGDLFNSRLCNALHAMPMRREGWFFTHVLAGILFCAVPNLLIALLMPLLDSFWYTAVLWYLCSLLQYLFFFLLGVACCICTGKWFAAVAVYGIVNFISLIALWVSTVILEPLLYGVSIPTDIFYLLCPVAQMLRFDSYWEIQHSGDCYCSIVSNVHQHEYEFAGLGSGCVYLVVLALIALVVGAIALVLYRRRALECAGDFLAFGPMQPVFVVILSLCSGSLLQIIASIFLDFPYIFGLIGVIVGFFVAQMLINRTVRVFQLKKWLFLAGTVAGIAVAIFACKADLFHIVRWVPDAQDITEIKIAEGQYETWTRYSGEITVSDPAYIQKVLTIHGGLIAEGPVAQRENRSYRWYTISYTLKNGKEVRRYYQADRQGTANSALYKTFFANPEYLLGCSTLDQLRLGTTELYCDGLPVLGATRDTLLELVFAAAEAGELENNVADWSSTVTSIELTSDKTVNRGVFYVSDRDSKLSLWAKLWLSMQDPEYLAENLQGVLLNGTELTEEQFSAFRQALIKDLSTQGVYYYSDLTDLSSTVTLIFPNGSIPISISDALIHVQAWEKAELAGD